MKHEWKSNEKQELNFFLVLALILFLILYLNIEKSNVIYLIVI
jgi:hypothetical protein